MGFLRRGPQRGARRALSLVASIVILLTVGAGMASAHVTVHPGDAVAGSWIKLTFRVPTESATASTTALTVALPDDHPFPSVSAMQLPGWTAQLTTTKLDEPVSESGFNLTEAVTSVTWTADDGVGIKPGEFMEFPLSVGPVPDVDELSFPADQTYSDGSVVSWDEPTPTDGPEPDHPAPVLTIASADAAQTDSEGVGTAGSSSNADSAGNADSSSNAEMTVSADGAASSDTTARILAVAALVLGALALLGAAFGLRGRAGDRHS